MELHTRVLVDIHEGTCVARAEGVIVGRAVSGTLSPVLFDVLCGEILLKNVTRDRLEYLGEAMAPEKHIDGDSVR